MQKRLKTKAEREADEKKIKEEYEKIYKFNKENLDHLAGQPEGIDAFRFLMDFCKYQKAVVHVNSQTNEINLQTTAFMEGRRSVYLELRKYINPKYLKKIEFK